MEVGMLEIRIDDAKEKWEVTLKKQKVEGQLRDPLL